MINLVSTLINLTIMGQGRHLFLSEKSIIICIAEMHILKGVIRSQLLSMKYVLSFFGRALQEEI